MHRRALVAISYAFLFVPLVLVPYNFYPFTTGKTVALRILAAIGLCIWAVKPRFPRHPIAWGVLAVAACGTLSTLVAPDPRLALWSSPLRQEGLANALAFSALFLVLANARLDWRRYFATMVMLACFVSVVGIAYHFWYVATQWTPAPKVHSLAGNSAYLGLYLALTILVTFWLWVGARIKDLEIMVWPWPVPLLRARPWLTAALVLQVWCLALTRNRGAILALAVGLAVWFVLARLAESRPQRHFWATWEAYRTSYRIRYAALFALALGALALSTLPWTGETMTQRFELWGIAWQMALERPILGWGHDGFFQGFTQRVHWSSPISQLPFDRAHNFVLDRLVQGGVPGLAAYLFLLWAMFRTGIDPLPKAILACYVTGNLFLFDVLETSVVFWSLAAFLVGRDIAQDAVVVAHGQPALDRGVRAGGA